MSKQPAIDAARLDLMFGDLRLPTMEPCGPLHRAGRPRRLAHHSLAGHPVEHKLADRVT